MSASVPIILTKLHPPLVRRNVSTRERLAGLLRQCVERRLTLVYAAPGYGKTTLIANTLAQSAAPVIWYSLSRSDRDLVTFSAYLLEALDRQWPGLAAQARADMTGDGAQPDSFVAACVNQLLQCAKQDFVIVIDDFQLVDHVADICRLVDQLILHAPPLAHFIIATRAAPPFPSLPRWRALSEVGEIGEADLRFTAEEAGALFEQTLDLRLNPDRVSALVEQTEGWALGLLLAGQSLRSGGGLDQRFTEAAADRRILFEYLGEEVLRQQSSVMVDFLTSSAILSRLGPALCDAALARSDSAARLGELEHNLHFVTRTEDGWLRYHRLFREFLLEQLANDPARREALHRRAAAYFEAQHDFETAVFHWLEAGAEREAAALITSQSAKLLQAGRLDTLEFWLNRLTAEVLNEFPELSCRWGQLCEARGLWDQALTHYERAAQAYTARGDLLGLSDVLRSKGHILDWRKGQHAEAERLHREALSYVGEEHRRQRAALLASLARNQLSAGYTTAAAALYREALTIYEADADRPGQLDTLLNPGSWLYHGLGDYTQALAVLRRAEQLATELDRPSQLVETYNGLAVNLYFLGRYAEAQDFADKALSLSVVLKDAHGEAFALMNQANAQESLCKVDYAGLYSQYQRALHIEQALGNRRFVIAVLVFMAVLARRGGHTSDAVRRAQQALPLATERGLRWLIGFVQVQLGAAQLWIDSRAARRSLEEALHNFTECDDVFHLTASHFWLAVLCHTEDHPAYLDHLRESLRLAVSHNFDHFYFAESQAAIPLLVSALENNLWPSYVAPILARFGNRAAGSLRALLTHASADVRVRAKNLLDEMRADPAPTVRPAKEGRGKGPAVAPLVIRGFGKFAVRRGNQIIEEREWGRRKVKRLLKYIAFSPDRTLPKDIAIDLLWGDSDPASANANFYRTLYNLRRVLEPLSPHSGANYIAMEGGLIRLAPETVPSTDVEDFMRGVEAGRRCARAGDRAAARAHLAEAVALYADDLATDDLYDDWIQARRQHLRDLYLSSLRELAELATEAGEAEQAIHYLRQAFRKDVTSEAACLNLMLALAETRGRAEALQHYGECEKALAEIGLAPSPELRVLQRELLVSP